MIPILFDGRATNFTTNGIGRLTKVLSCDVTEERNGVYELDMTLSIDSDHFSDVKHSAIIACIPHDGGTIQGFRIYKITKPMNGSVRILARHVSYQLSKIPVRPFTANNVVTALGGIKGNSMETNPFTFHTDKSTIASYNQKKPESARTRLLGQQGSILDVYGGEYEWDNWDVHLWNNRGTDKGVTLRYGKNITDVKQEENIDNTITGIVPFWSGGEDEVVYYDGVVSADTADNFPYHLSVPHDFSSDFQNKPTTEQLRLAAQRYILRNQIGIPAVSIKVSFVALWQTEEYKDVAPLQRVKLCDYVTIYFEKLGITAKAKVVKTVYDVLNERYSSIQLGEAKTDFASYVVGLERGAEVTAAAVASNRNQVSAQIDKALVTFEETMHEAIESATDEIIGAKGGNIVTHLNEQNQPYELLVTDNLDLSMAKNIWRWNIGGLGFSKNGYNGPYGLAITQSGAIVADFITVGTLTANIIRAGILRDLNNKNWWNLNTGEMVISGRLNAATGTFAGELRAATGSFSGQIKGGTIQIGGTDAAPIFAVNADGKVVMKNFDLDGVGNAATIGCSVMNCENLRAGTAVIEGDLNMNGGTINAGDINASSVGAGTVECGNLYCQNPPWTSIYDDSDRRLKKNIEDINGKDALAFILALNPKSYTLKKDDRDALGFIAQDMQETMKKLNVEYPLIKERGDGMLSLNYQNLIALIISAIQEIAKGG